MSNDYLADRSTRTVDFSRGQAIRGHAWSACEIAPLPFPSTTAGALRSQSNLTPDGVFQLPEDKEERKQRLQALKAISVRGPLLVSLEPDGETIDQWLVPAPADALLLNVKTKDADKIKEEDNEGKQENTDEKAIVKRLVPFDLKTEKDQVYTDFTLKQSDGQEALQVVGLPLDGTDSNLEKPHKKAPRYWYWSAFEQWLSSPTPFSQSTIAELGTNGPSQEMRVHVAMDHSTRAGKDERLFDTSGLEFTHIKAFSDASPGSPLERAQRLALALIINDERDKPNKQNVEIANRLGTLGSERRLVSWRESPGSYPSPTAVRDQIIEMKRCRLFLLTPAYFSQGYRPTWLYQQHESGVHPHLRAIAIQRPQVVSGWDIALERPKPSRRLAPAGTVLFLELEGDKDAIGRWIDEIWFSCVSDDIEGSDQYRLDGFGLAVLGAWSSETDQGGKA